SRQAVKLPLLLHYTSMWENRSIRNGKGGTLWLVNRNRLLKQFPGTDGLKTGYTPQAGFCLADTAKQSGMRLIAVVLGAPSSSARFQDAQALMTWGFNNFRTVSAVQPHQAFGTVAVRGGSRRQIVAVADRARFITVPVDKQNAVRRTVQLDDSVNAPIKAGQVIGHVIVKVGEQTILQIPLVAQHSIEKVGILQRSWQYFWQMV
ncbi:MAG: D-alanyl-D-alanine carboxypeptidase, partial [Firmicutes bacterium]|nr:D-alanyl-D-alanine carboxypeptidase [Bacillota bacterium]